jgi:hypothetical protein
MESDREVGPTKGGEEFEACGDERPDHGGVDEWVGDQPSGEQAVTGCGPVIVERAEYRDSHQRYPVEAVEAFGPAGVAAEQRDGIRTAAQKNDGFVGCPFCSQFRSQLLPSISVSRRPAPLFGTEHQMGEGGRGLGLHAGQDVLVDGHRECGGGVT